MTGCARDFSGDCGPLYHDRYHEFTDIQLGVSPGRTDEPARKGPLTLVAE
jgi:hypothetical protein